MKEALESKIKMTCKMEGESICKQESKSNLRTSTESIPVFLLYLSIYEQWENIGPRRIVQTAVTFRNTIIWGLLLALSLPPAFLGFLYSVFWVRNEHKKKEMKVRGFHHVSVGGVWWWGENGGLSSAASPAGAAVPSHSNPWVGHTTMNFTCFL